ncbi:unnamed protein product [Symbiodinium pilosum]|uniref:Uncharacterized protein n=1 Tax=Symbiodinium pilosum TaxID=2952 RepID=A0A812JLK8_SYMPI|nr:unnamed protein product [Symbiodinium pilosum]
MLALESGMTMDEVNKCSLAASNAWADECMAKAIKPSKANVQAVAIRGSGPADKITVSWVHKASHGSGAILIFRH